MKSIQYFTAFAFLLSMWNLSAQDRVEFKYDNAGNRISRTIFFNSLKSTLNEEAEEELEEEAETSGLTDIIDECVIRIYPNPTKGLLRVDIESLPDNETAKIILYSLAGQLITTQQDIATSTELNLGNQPQGVYLLHIWIGGEKREWKIIKK